MSDQSGIGRRPRFASQYRVRPAIFDELKSKAEATRRKADSDRSLSATSRRHECYDILTMCAITVQCLHLGRHPNRALLQSETQTFFHSPGQSSH
jgi:hypothetical protein